MQEYKDILRVPYLVRHQRKWLFEALKQFNHGLWPLNWKMKNNYFNELSGSFGENAGKLWTKSEDKLLLELSHKYDVEAEYGDPWLYICYDMRRSDFECRDRYIHLKMRPKHR